MPLKPPILIPTKSERSKQSSHFRCNCMSAFHGSLRWLRVRASRHAGVASIPWRGHPLHYVLDLSYCVATSRQKAILEDLPRCCFGNRRLGSPAALESGSVGSISKHKIWSRSVRIDFCVARHSTLLDRGCIGLSRFSGD